MLAQKCKHLSYSYNFCYLKPIYKQTKTIPDISVFSGRVVNTASSAYRMTPKLHLQSPKTSFQLLRCHGKTSRKEESTFFQVWCLVLQQQKQPCLLLICLSSNRVQKILLFLTPVSIWLLSYYDST